MKKLSMIVAAAAVAGLTCVGASSAQARSSWSVGFSTGGWYGPPAYYPAPVYYAPAPIYVAPRPCYGPYYGGYRGYGYPGSFSFSYRHR